MKSKNQKRRDPAELLRTFKRLCPTKDNGTESITILRREHDGFEALMKNLNGKSKKQQRRE